MVVLASEIAADRDGQSDYQAALRRLAIDKEDTTKRLQANQEWARNFDDKIKPFEAT